LIRAARLILGIFFGIGALLALITTFVVFGYVFKIIAFLGALLCVLVFIVFLVWAAIKEFVFDAKKKPPK
jgi:hypothetical protein